MTIVALYIFGLAIPLPARTCVELGPRLDRTYVTVCDGSVVRVRDEQGNSQEWDRFTNTVVVRRRGAAPVVLAAR